MGEIIQVILASLLIIFIMSIGGLMWDNKSGIVYKTIAVMIWISGFIVAGWTFSLIGN